MESTKYWIISLVVSCVSLVFGWHGFANTPYHCWDLTASATNSIPFTCNGIVMTWISVPGDSIKAQEGFNMSFTFTVDDAFYASAYASGYFSQISSVTSAATAKTWCETTSCPSASTANSINCCVHHVNVHSCPLEDTTNGLCGPWISPSGSTFTHSDVIVGPVGTGTWTCYVQGLYQLGVTSLIAHIKIAGMQVALETKTNVLPRAECGDSKCEGDEGEDCESCPKDCGACPLKVWQIILIALVCFLIVGGIVGVIFYFQYQKRKLLWDESWILDYESIKQDDGLRGAFGSMLGSTMDLSLAPSDGTHSMAVSAARRQVFAKTALYDGRTCALRPVRKKEFVLTKDVRWEVRDLRQCDHQNLAKFIGASIVVPNVCILTEYCPKGSLSDVLLNDDVPLNWSFRFSFAADISRGMHYIHSHKLLHGRLKSNNCVIDDKWTVKLTDFGIPTLRQYDVMLDVDDEHDDDGEEDRYYQEKRAQVYLAPEVINEKVYTPTPAGDVYAFAIILIEIALRNDPYGDEDALSVQPGWRPELPDLSPEMAEDKDEVCPCPSAYLQLIQECWDSNPEYRPTFDVIKKTIHKINPNKLSPVDLMMAMMVKYSKHLESIVADRTQDLVAEKAKTDRLLYSMLPKLVADELRMGKSIEAEIHDACTIYFSDIVGFTTISGGSTPMQVVALLNKLYITFDEIIDKYDVYKVETIGDAYMVVSGIPTATTYHAREIADMAIDLVQACKVFTIPHMPDEPLKIRVGLHSGSACAGVVGLKMPRYCLFGDTVNTASRMESNGEAYKIHISNFTYVELIRFGKYVLETRGAIPIKGKGEMVTWWVNGHDPSWYLVQENNKKNTVSHLSVNNSSTKMNTSIGSMSSVKQNVSNGGINGKTLQNGHVSKQVRITDTGKTSDSVGSVTRLGTETSITAVDIDNNVKGKLDFTDVDDDNEYLFKSVELKGTGDHPVDDTNVLICREAPNIAIAVDTNMLTNEDKLANMRKISKISTVTDDSGYTDRTDEVTVAGDFNDVVVGSTESIPDAVKKDTAVIDM